MVVCVLGQCGSTCITLHHTLSQHATGQPTLCYCRGQDFPAEQIFGLGLASLAAAGVSEWVRGEGRWLGVSGGGGGCPYHLSQAAIIGQRPLTTFSTHLSLLVVYSCPPLLIRSSVHLHVSPLTVLA